ncbi:MAG: hypothetical protein H8E98_03875, partial [Bacteroidetes bacterium]|nr:hypothetical protein [Bacteroidota bacterium]
INTLDYAKVILENGEESEALLLTKENELKIEFFLRHFEGDTAIHSRIRELILRRIFNIKR